MSEIDAAREMDEMLSDHGDMEGVLGELLGDSEELDQEDKEQ